MRSYQGASAKQVNVVLEENQVSIAKGIDQRQPFAKDKQIAQSQGGGGHDEPGTHEGIVRGDRYLNNVGVTIPLRAHII